MDVAPGHGHALLSGLLHGRPLTGTKTRIAAYHALRLLAREVLDKIRVETGRLNNTQPTDTCFAHVMQVRHDWSNHVEGRS
jgi:hypothetical protein